MFDEQVCTSADDGTFDGCTIGNDPNIDIGTGNKCECNKSQEETLDNDENEIDTIHSNDKNKFEIN
jgi:hypothetical protein